MDTSRLSLSIVLAACGSGEGVGGPAKADTVLGFDGAFVGWVGSSAGFGFNAAAFDVPPTPSPLPLSILSQAKIAS